MTVLRAFDAADPTISIPAMVQHGAIIAPVYIVGNPGGFGHADRARVTALRKAGIAPLANWERAANYFATCTIAQARAAGVEALTACRDLGFPDDGSIDVAFSFDYNIPSGDYAAAMARLVAANQGLAGHYQAIAYGPCGFLKYLAAHGQPGPHWLMASTFRTTSKFDVIEVNAPHVGLVQSHDAYGNWLDTPIRGTDVNTVIQPYALGAWWPDNSPYRGDNMPLTDAEIQKIADRVWAARFKNPINGHTYPASSYLVYANIFGSQAKAAIASLPGVVVDATAVGAAITAEVKSRLAALFGGTS